MKSANKSTARSTNLAPKLKPIDSFTGEYDWLSNFYLVDVQHEGLRFPSVEHAYQAAKIGSESYCERIRFANWGLSSAGAKRKGQTVELRDDWESVKDIVMYECLQSKFSDHDLRKKLLATGDAELIEGNYWHDNYWGDCRCNKRPACKKSGQNNLGLLIMQVREEIRAEIE